MWDNTRPTPVTIGSTPNLANPPLSVPDSPQLLRLLLPSHTHQRPRFTLFTKCVRVGGGTRPCPRSPKQNILVPNWQPNPLVPN